MAFFLQRKRCEIRVKFVGLKFTAPPSCYLAWLNRERHTFFYFPYPAGPLCWCASQPSLQTDRCSGLRRWMGVQRWNLSEVEKNKGRRRSPSPPPRYGLTWGFYWDDAEIHFRTLHYFTADLKLLGTIGGGMKMQFRALWRNSEVLLCVAMTILQHRSRVEVCLALYSHLHGPAGLCSSELRTNSADTCSQRFRV